ncbi:MAG: class I SAM-dependent methyltransferase [Balneolaceae bacterium]
MSWFEKWFDSPLYEVLYAYRNEEDARKLADLIEGILPAKSYPSLVDVGCGRGRHSITLAGRGYQVTGFDLSSQAIKKARARAKEKRVKKIRFLVHDMRRPLPERFDAAVNLFTTFGYFREEVENLRVLKSINQMLKPDGAFLIDFLNAEKVKRDLVPFEQGKHEGVYYTIERKIEDGFVYKTMSFSGRDIDGCETYTERVKLFELNWFERNLEKAGFSLKHVYGSYTGSKFDKINSDRLIILSEKTVK